MEERRVRITMELPVDDANRLAGIASRTGYNEVTTIVRALRLLDSLEAAWAEGGDIQVHYRGGRRERILR